LTLNRAKQLNDNFLNTEDASAVMASMLRGSKATNNMFAQVEMLEAA